MSLEQAIKDNTAAVLENTATVRELIAALHNMNVPQPNNAGNELPIGAATDKVIETAKKAPVETAKNYAAPEKEDAPTVKETEPLDFQEHIVKPFGKLCVAKGREAGAAILAKWGVDKLSKIPADKHAELVADIINASV